MMAPVYVRCKELKKVKRKGTLAPDAPKTKAEIKAQARAEALELGAEIGHGTLERTVEITVGTNIDTLMGAEILTEDGKIIAFRE